MASQENVVSKFSFEIQNLQNPYFLSKNIYIVKELSNHLEIMEICALNFAKINMKILLNSTSNEEVNSKKKKHLIEVIT
jgi:hypothetical protein